MNLAGGASQYCTHCGMAVARAGARFCHTCGQSLGGPPSIPVAPSMTGPPPASADWHAGAGQPGWSPSAQAMPQHPGPLGKVRHPAAVILLAICTAGIYSIVWLVSLWSEARRYVNGRRGVRTMGGGGALAAFFLLPIFLGAAGCGLGAAAAEFRTFRRIVGRSADASGFVAATPVWVAAVIVSICGAVKTPGLVRKMRIADGYPPEQAGHPGALAFCVLVPFIGSFLWMGLTQHRMNEFWRREAGRMAYQP